MKNTETKALETELPDAATLLREEHECVRFFCTTLTSLNNIFLEYQKGLLNIVITAVEVARSLSSSKTDEGAMITSGANADEVTALVEQLRSAGEELNKTNIGQQAGITAGTQSAASNSGTFCSQVEVAILLAMNNTVYSQQEANVTTQAAMTMAIAMLLSLPSKGQGITGVSNTSDQGEAA